jgi:hypothetical protein
MSSPLGPSPDTPTPRQELIAAEYLALDCSVPRAARLAGLRTATLHDLLADPEFQSLVEESRALVSLPAAERKERLARHLHRALEHALAEGRVGAIATAMRLLGLAPARTRDPEEDEEPDEPPSGERWGMHWDPEGEAWRTPDGRPAMPGRDLAVVHTPGGPARCLETAEMAEAWPDMIPGFDATEPDHLHQFNRLAYPQGGPQWDPRTRTLWYWGAPGGAASVKAAVPAGPGPATPPPLPPAKHVEDLRAQLDRLLASTAAVGPEDEDLAEAVCSVLWPNWPAYRGDVDLWRLRDLLARTPVEPTTLARLGGVAPAGTTPRPAHWPAQHGRGPP